MRGLILLGVCCALVTADLTHLTVNEAKTLLGSAVTEFLAFTERGNELAPGTPPFTLFPIQGNTIRMKYDIDTEEKTFTVKIPPDIVLEQSNIPELKTFFHEKVAVSFPLLSPMEDITRLSAGGPETAVITWPSDRVHRLMYKFIYIFHAVSDYEAPQSMYTLLHPGDFMQCLTKALLRFNKFVSDGNVDNSLRAFSLLMIQGKEMQLTYEIDSTKKIFLAKIPDSFAVPERDIHTLTRTLEAEANREYPRHLFSSITNKVGNRRGAFIGWPPETEHFTFTLSFPVSSIGSRVVSLLIEQLAARLIE